MGNQKVEGYATESIWRLAMAAGQGFHKAAVGDANREAHVVGKGKD